MQTRAGRLGAWLGIFTTVAALTFAASVARAQGTTLDAPDTAPSGSRVRVSWTGPKQLFDRICVVPPGVPDKYRAEPFSAFTNNVPAILVPVPEGPGDYELRFVQGKTGQVLARRKLTVTPVTATLE